MIALLASYVSVLGQRFASGLNDDNEEDNTNPGQFDGRFIDSSSNYLVTSSGDYLEYVEYR